ncbi:MAG: hypothetical protein Q4E63_01460 [Prevotellaceae bacterium]|nr:hypothetical protein [Prevotellaceae bacterium]MDO4931309.1 hypothetical protein [Prevotellaceae bacterium]
MNRIHRILFIACLLMANITVAMAVNVKVNAAKGVSQTVIQKIESNLNSLLNEINDAQTTDRPLQLNALPISASAKETLNKLWAVAQFYCCDDEVTDRLWNFKKNYMVRSIPLIIVPDAADKWADGTYQEAVVEFDMNGNITSFNFSFSSRLGESMERCSGSVVDAQRRLEILAWCDRLATAYNEKNMPFMKEVFSEKALIISGHVTKVLDRETGRMTEKVSFNKQTKQEYLANLEKSFAKNKWIKVEFDEVGLGGCNTVTKSSVNENFYGVRLHQKWKSTNYSDDGYVFLLWNFGTGGDPQIEVRTWQPDIVNGKKVDADEIISLGDFESDIVDM